MRVLVAPGAFGGTLSASAAGEAIASGWARTSPGDTVDVVPMAGADQGFVEALHASCGGDRLEVDARGPFGGPVRGLVLLLDDAGLRTAYVDSASVCGPDGEARRAPEDASTAGVGDLVAAAIEAGAARVVVGLGAGIATDGGAGMLGALGARADVPLDAGPAGLVGVTSVDLDAVRAQLGHTELVVATDVASPLLGLFGAVRADGPGKGLDEAAVARVDRVLDAYVVAVCGGEPARRRIADLPGAGAGGGLGFALLALGASVQPGVATVADRVGLATAARVSDLVLTGTGAYDVTSREGTVVFGVASVAGDALRPCVVLADRVEVGARERRAMGVEAAYAIADLEGAERFASDPAGALVGLAARVARTWSPL